MSRSLRFVFNAGSNLLGQAVVSVLTLALLPQVVRGLGVDGYAWYALMGNLAGYLTLLAFGAGPATLKFVSELTGAQDRERLAEAVGLSLIMHAAAVAAGALLVALFAEPLAAFFSVPVALRPHARFVFGCLAAGTVCMSLLRFSMSALQGLHRFAESNLLLMLESGGMLSCAALALRLHYGLKGVAGVFAAVYAALAAAGLFLALRRLPAPAWPWRRGPDLARRFLSFGSANFAGALAWAIPFQLDKAFVSHFLPLGELTYYQISASLMQKFSIVPGSVSATAFPHLSELHGADDPAALRKVYRLCSQLVLWLAVPGFVLVMVLAPQFLTLWLGESFSLRCTWPLRVLLLGYFLNFMAAMPGAAISGTGHLVRYGAMANGVFAVVCMICWSVLLPRVGIVGASWGFFAGNVVAFVPYILFANRRLFGMGVGEYLRTICLRPFAAGAFLTCFLWLLRPNLFSWTALLLVGAGSGALYLAAAWKLLDDESRASVRFLRDKLLPSR